MEPRYVLNKADPQSTIPENRLSECVGQPFYGKIPRDDKLMEKVQLRKQDVWQTNPGSPYAAAMESLAWRLTTRRIPASKGGAGFSGVVSRSAKMRAIA